MPKRFIREGPATEVCAPVSAIALTFSGALLPYPTSTFTSGGLDTGT